MLSSQKEKGAEEVLTQYSNPWENHWRIAEDQAIPLGGHTELPSLVMFAMLEKVSGVSYREDGVL